MKRLTIPLLLTIALLAAAPAEAGKRERATTFSGSCSFAGTVRFDPPLTGTPQEGRGFAYAAGTCNGRPARYVAWNEGTVSCGEGVATGGGYLVIRGKRLRFRLTETRATGAAALRLEGVRGGGAVGSASVSASENPAEIAAKCAGPGLSQTRVDINISTTPSISG